ncbi:MAG: tRNA adenosine(34) deaminase TadA [Bacillota bacterium]
MSSTALHQRYMAEALVEARFAAGKGEVPVGAVVVAGGAIVGRGHNLRETTNDPTAHAEMLALRAAARHLGTWRLEGAVMYVTLEPCAMCAGALVLARVATLVYGADDPKAGACGSVLNVVQHPRLNHRLEVIRGVGAEEAAELLRSFFAELRRRPGGNGVRRVP